MVVNNLVQKYTQNSTTTSTAKGGGVMLFSGGAFTVANSILWGNSKIIQFNSLEEQSEFELQTSALVSINNSLIKKQNPTGAGNVDATVIGFDPLFVSQIGQNYHLLAGSPLINSGNNSFLPVDTYDLDNDGDVLELIPFDLDGSNRISIGIVDIGPYEFIDEVFFNGFE